MASAPSLRPHAHSAPPNCRVGSSPNPNDPRRWAGEARRVALIGRRGAPSRLRTWCSLSAAAASAQNKPSFRYAVLGAGFAGLSVAWHLLKQSSKESRICVDIYDDAGIGGGASGASGGLLHPYSPKARLLWRGGECWRECLDMLLNANRAVEARAASEVSQDGFNSFDESIVWKRGIIRPASEKNVEILRESAMSSLENCHLELLDRNATQSLVPDLSVPFDLAVYMPLAMNIHPKRYLEALFLACNDLAKREENEIYLFRESIKSLQQLSEDYDAVVICLGANVERLPQLSGKLPLRTCRGVVVHLQLPNSLLGEYDHQRPSILADAWLAFREPWSVFMGSTWDWHSTNYGSTISEEETSRAMEQLLPKASSVYPPIRNWSFVGAQAGLRAMPPLTPYGSLPLLGCVNDIIGESVTCKYWLVGGLGSRGLLYHGLVGKLTAQAILSSNENVLPPEFTSWKKISK